jgi:ribosome maturation factor RimP
MITKEIVQQFAQERIDERFPNVFIVAISISSSNAINIELDKKDGGVSIDECVAVSRNVEHNLDREEHDFELHVSSAGLDKPLRVYDQYPKNIGRGLECVLTDGKLIEGKLMNVTPEGITIESQSKEIVEGKKTKQLVTRSSVLSFEEIKEAKIVISFK